MNIVFFTDTFCPTINGVVTSIVYFANGLVAQGHHVLIVAPRHKESRREAWGLDERVQTLLVASLDGKVYPDIRIALPTLKIWREVKRFEPEIVLSFTPLSLGINGLLIAKILKIPSVMYHMTNYTDEEAGKAIGQYPQLVVRRAQQGAEKATKWLLNFFDHVFVPSTDTEKDLLQMGVTTAMTIAPLPVDSSRLEQGKQRGLELRKRLGIQQSMLFAGRLSGEKNVDKVIQVFALVLERIPECKLVLIGDGPARKDLFELANTLRVNPSISWFGSVYHTELIDNGYYYLGDVFISLSEFETQGLSTVEAMTCGLFPIGMRSRAMTEVIAHSGVLIQKEESFEAIAEKIVSLFNETEEQKNKQRQIILREAKRFDKDRCVQIILESFHQLLA